MVRKGNYKIRQLNKKNKAAFLRIFSDMSEGIALIQSPKRTQDNEQLIHSSSSESSSSESSDDEQLIDSSSVDPEFAKIIKLMHDRKSQHAGGLKDLTDWADKAWEGLALVFKQYYKEKLVNFERDLKEKNREIESNQKQITELIDANNDLLAQISNLQTKAGTRKRDNENIYEEMDEYIVKESGVYERMKKRNREDSD